MNQAEFRQAIKEARWLIMDMDGVLTDGHVYMSTLGEQMRAFSILDGYGMKKLSQNGINLAVITGSPLEELVHKRMLPLGVKHCICSCSDKASALKHLAKEANFSLEHVVYMGDDVPDIPPMELVGLSVSVPNGHHLVRDVADYVTTAYGGKGAVREICDWFIKEQLL